MEETIKPPRQKGLFDRGTLGMTLSPVSVMIERGRIQFLAQVLGEADPIHSDVEAARRAGHPDIVAPPSYFMVIEADANRELARRGEKSSFALVGCDYRYLLHGDESYDDMGNIYAGDEVVLTTKVAGFYDREGGVLEFVNVVSEVTHTQRGVLVRATRTLLHRLD